MHDQRADGPGECAERGCRVLEPSGSAKPKGRGKRREGAKWNTNCA